MQAKTDEHVLSQRGATIWKLLEGALRITVCPEVKLGLCFMMAASLES